MRKDLESEIDAARDSIKRKATAYYAGLLAKALAMKDLELAQRAITRHSAIAEKPAAVTASALAEKTDFRSFLDDLVSIGFGTPRGQPRENYADLSIIEACMDRFSDKAEASQYISKGYAKWSESLTDERLPGLGLYMASIAEAHGAGIKREARERLMLQASKQLGARIRFAEPVVDDPLFAGYVETFQRSVGTYLLRPFSGWLMQADAADSIAVVLRLHAVESSHEKAVTNKTVRYQSGIRKVPNPEFVKKQAAIEEQEMALLAAKKHSKDIENNSKDVAKRVANASHSILDRSGAMMDLVAEDDARREASKAGNRVLEIEINISSAKSDLNYSTPKTLDEPVYDYERYEDVNHSLVHRFLIEIEFAASGRLGNPALTLASDTVENVNEVIGNARHGVPVLAAEFKAKKIVAAELSSAMENKLQDQRLYGLLGEALYQSVQARSEAGKLTDRQRADRLWCLRELWVRSGQDFPHEQEVTALVRECLGL